MTFCPLVINLEKVKITIFGGGEVANRKVKNLLGSNITIVAEKVIEEIESLNSITIVRKKIKQENDVIHYIKDSDFVIIATNDSKINTMIKNICKNENKIYNSVDDKDSKVIFPAFIYDRDLIIAVSTSGKAPALASYIKEDVMQHVNKYTKAINIIEKIRKNIGHGEERRKRFFRMLFKDEQFWDLIDNEAECMNYAISKWREYADH
jgi:precorrin-2 dehydrogenase/sirohydrochlorin ferrochelatase